VSAQLSWVYYNTKPGHSLVPILNANLASTDFFSRPQILVWPQIWPAIFLWPHTKTSQCYIHVGVYCLFLQIVWSLGQMLSDLFYTNCLAVLDTLADCNFELLHLPDLEMAGAHG
jgi:hypothetical protein